LLADKFVNRFSNLVDAGAGWDYPYAGWLLRVLGLAEAGWIPFVFADYASVRFDFMFLSDARSKEGNANDSGKTPALPLPPAGESRQDYQA
jgi:hypothetical protein